MRAWFRFANPARFLRLALHYLTGWTQAEIGLKLGALIDGLAPGELININVPAIAVEECRGLGGNARWEVVEDCAAIAFVITSGRNSRQVKTIAEEYENVYEAEDGQAGLESICRHQPDIVIVDGVIHAGHRRECDAAARSRGRRAVRRPRQPGRIL